MPTENSEFRKRVSEIEKSIYRGGFRDMIDFACKRAEFEEEKLRRLISLANQTNLSHAKRKEVTWKRMLARSQTRRETFARLQQECLEARRAFSVAPFSTNSDRN